MPERVPRRAASIRSQSDARRGRSEASTLRQRRLVATSLATQALIPGTTGQHQMKSVPRLSSQDGSGRVQLEGFGPTRNRKVVGSNPTSGSKTAGQRHYGPLAERSPLPSWSFFRPESAPEGPSHRGRGPGPGSSWCSGADPTGKVVLLLAGLLLVALPSSSCSAGHPNALLTPLAR